MKRCSELYRKIAAILCRGDSQLQSRVAEIVGWFARNEPRIVSAWIMLVVAAAALKAATAPTPPHTLTQAVAMTLPFLIVAAAPVFGYRFGNRFLVAPAAMRQPRLRLARYGAWRVASAEERAKGRPSGLVWYSLVSGILFNVPVRALEYLLSIPAVAASDPLWAHAIVQAFTMDCAVMCFVYAACFAAARHNSPLFPRLLVAAWVLDAAMQGVIATYVGAHADLPAMLVDPMTSLLQTNVKKVGISATIWLPYLLISETVNLHLRGRVRVPRAFTAAPASA